MKFSVIIPVYNVAPYLKACLDSVLAAAEKAVVGSGRGGESFLHSTTTTTHYNYSSVEIICIDDGSADGSGEILDEYGEKVQVESPSPRRDGSIHSSTSTFNFDLSPHSTFRVLHQPNAGVSAARNAGLDVATGDYICFVDGDDGVVADYFVQLAKFIEATNADMITFDYQSVDRPEAMVADSETDPSCRVIDLMTTDGAVRGFNSVVSATWAWNMTVRRSTVGDLRFTPLPNGEDILFAAQAFYRANTVALTDAKLYKYLYRPGSAVRVKTLKHLKSVCAMSKELKRSTDDWKWGKLVRGILKRKSRGNLMQQVVAYIPQLPSSERAEAWDAFFDALSVCSWSMISSEAARTRSRLLARMLLVVQKGRIVLLRIRCVSKLKNIVRRREV